MVDPSRRSRLTDPRTTALWRRRGGWKGLRGLLFFFFEKFFVERVPVLTSTNQKMPIQPKDAKVFFVFLPLDI